MIQEKRVKTGLSLVPSALEQCNKNLKLAGARSRNDFVEKAIEFYAGYLNAESNPKFYEEMYSKSGEIAVKKTGDTLIKSQYRMAVELAKLTHLLAEAIDISPAQLDNLAQKCVKECKDLAGIWSAEDIVRFRKNYQR